MKIRLRLNSKGWFWLWMTISASEWPPVREIWVGPSDTAPDAFDGATLARSLMRTGE